MTIYLVWAHDYDEVNLLGIYANREKAKEVVVDYNDGDFYRGRLPYAVIESREVE